MGICVQKISAMSTRISVNSHPTLPDSHSVLLRKNLGMDGERKLVHTSQERRKNAAEEKDRRVVREAFFRVMHKL